MADFSDAFDRADGPLGNGWTINSGAAAIVSSNAVDAGNGVVVNSGATGTTYQEASVTSIGNAGGSNIVCPVVKGASGSLHYYYGRVYLFSGTWYASIFKMDNGATEIAYTTLSGAITGTVTTRLVYNSGHLSFYINGTKRTEVDDSALSAYTLAGMWFPADGGTASLFDSANSEPAPYLTISPATVYSGNPLNAMRATLHDAVWSDVSPPSATLSVDLGLIVVQTMESTTNYGFSFQSLFQNGTVTVTESEFGAQGTFTLSEFPVGDNGDSWPITEDGAALINNGDATCEDAAILTTCTPIDQEGTVNIPKGIDAIIEQLGGYPGQVGPDIGAVSTPAAILAKFERPVINPYWTIEDVVGALGGTPTIYSNADLYTALGNLPAATYQPVLDALVALQGDDPPTLAQIGAMISDLSTVAGYTLQDVKDWIDAISAPDLSAITTKLDAIQPSTDYNLSTLTTKSNSIGVDVGAVLTALGLLTTDGALSLATILDAISALSDLVQSQRAVTAPVWPSLDQVTLGAPVAFDGNVDVTADMDGVLVTLTTSPTKTGKYMLGNVDLWYGLGRISFESDNGDVEPWQYLAFDNGIFAPKTMAHASAVHLQVLGGAEGTVTPWTVNVP